MNNKFEIEALEQRLEFCSCPSGWSTISWGNTVNTADYNPITKTVPTTDIVNCELRETDWRGNVKIHNIQETCPGELKHIDLGN